MSMGGIDINGSNPSLEIGGSFKGSLIKRTRPSLRGSVNARTVPEFIVIINFTNLGGQISVFAKKLGPVSPFTFDCIFNQVNTNKTHKQLLHKPGLIQSFQSEGKGKDQYQEP